MTPKETSADALTDEQKKRIASIVHTDCTLIPGATFYNAAELAIAETLAALPVPVDARQRIERLGRNPVEYDLDALRRKAA